jgi:hypothetical protein
MLALIKPLFTAARGVASSASGKKEAFKLVGKYWDDGVNLLRNRVSDGLVKKLDIFSTASSLGTLAIAEASGQAQGSTTDFLSGFLDLGQEKFREDGGDQSGSRNMHLGKILQNVGLTIFSMMPQTKLAAKIGANNLNYVYKGIAAWQASTVASDLLAPDHAGIIEGTSDTVGGLASAARFTKLIKII